MDFFFLKVLAFIRKIWLKNGQKWRAEKKFYIKTIVRISGFKNAQD